MFFICVKGLRFSGVNDTDYRVYLLGNPVSIFKIYIHLQIHFIVVALDHFAVMCSWLKPVFQVVWWINLASLGLYVIMVAVASIALQRGFSLGQKRIGMVINCDSTAHFFAPIALIMVARTGKRCKHQIHVLHVVSQRILMCSWEKEDCCSSAGCCTMHLSTPWAVCSTTTTTSLRCSSTAC